MSGVREKVAWAIAGTLALLAAAAISGAIEGGPLDPPSAPSIPTDSVRVPGTPITTVPFTASAPGHYYLTRNLTSASEGISITSSDVSLDLGGFTLAGPGGAGTGIFVDQTKTGTVIRNGTVRNWNFGIRQLLDLSIDTEIVVEDVTVSNTTDDAIVLAGSARLRNCTVNASGSIGIQLSAPGGMIDNCAVRGADFIGINANSGLVRNCEVTGVTSAPNSGVALSGGVIDSCRVHDNSTGSAVSLGATGIASNIVVEGNTNESTAINMSQGATLRDCIVRANTADGIRTADGSLIEDCVVDANGGIGIDADVNSVVRGSTVTNNTGDGMLVASGSLVEGNAVADNGGDGIEASTAAHIIDNVVRLNGAALADGAGIHITGAGNYIEGNDLSSNDIGIRSDVAPSVIVRNSARNHAVANYQTQAADLTGVLITAANEGTSSVPHYNDAP
jgi:hypothetical protein